MLAEEIWCSKVAFDQGVQLWSEVLWCYRWMKYQLMNLDRCGKYFSHTKTSSLAWSSKTAATAHLQQWKVESHVNLAYHNLGYLGVSGGILSILNPEWWESLILRHQIAHWRRTQSTRGTTSTQGKASRLETWRDALGSASGTASASSGLTIQGWIKFFDSLYIVFHT